jgi:Ca2+-binding EF-hand superfamily protein
MHQEGADPVADIEEARKAFERFDVDGDGFITAAEYKSVMAQLGDFHVTEPVAEAVIAAQDSNRDKLLSFDEFWAHLNKGA